MTQRQRKAYEVESRAMIARQDQDRTEQAEIHSRLRKELENKLSTNRRELEQEHQRQWFDLRDRFGITLGPAGMAILAKGRC